MHRWQFCCPRLLSFHRCVIALLLHALQIWNPLVQTPVQTEFPAQPMPCIFVVQHCAPATASMNLNVVWLMLIHQSRRIIRRALTAAL
jgi:hypothetical protein